MTKRNVSRQDKFLQYHKPWTRALRRATAANEFHRLWAKGLQAE